METAALLKHEQKIHPSDFVRNISVICQTANYVTVRSCSSIVMTASHKGRNRKTASGIKQAYSIDSTAQCRSSSQLFLFALARMCFETILQNYNFPQAEELLISYSSEMPPPYFERFCDSNWMLSSWVSGWTDENRFLGHTDHSPLVASLEE